MYRQATVIFNNTPAPFYIQQCLEPDMANVGWVKVSSNITVNSANASNTWLWDVLQSPASNNQIGQNWYIALGWDNASNANMVCTIFEQWNVAGSNQCSGYPPGCTQNAAGGSYPIVANGWCNVNSSTLPLSPNSNCGYLTCGAGNFSTTNAFSNGSFTYFHSVSIDRVITMSSNTAGYATNVNAGHAYYIGTYDSYLNPVQDPFPIVAINMDVRVTSALTTSFGPVSTAAVVANNICGFATREPSTNTTAGNDSWGVYLAGPMAFMPSWGAFNQDFYATKYQYSRALVCGRQAGQRGLLKDVYVTQASPLNRGDTTPITINGVTYAAVAATNTQNNGNIVAYLTTALATFLQI